MNQTSSTSPPPIPCSWVEALFDRMLLHYGKRFTDQWGGADPGRLTQHWANELAGFTPAELSKGYAALEGRDWPPTVPEFKRLCRPALDVIAAYYEAIEGIQARERGEVGQWSHPAIYWAAVKIGAHDLKNQSFSQMRERWERAFNEVFSQGTWAAIPEPAKALPAPGKTVLSRSDAERRLQELGASGVLKKNTQHRAWIGKVLERAKNKDASLPSISVRMAKEALKEKEN